MRERWVWRNGKMMQVDAAAPRPQRVHIIPDIQPYQSTITGQPIGSRSTHRIHLRDHGCVEVGNDYRPQQRREPEGVGEDLKRAAQKAGVIG